MLFYVFSPKLDGLKLTRLFKFDERYSHIPVITVSHVAKSQDPAFLKDLGVNSFFAKPIDAEVVTQEIEKLLKV